MDTGEVELTREGQLNANILVHIIFISKFIDVSVNCLTFFANGRHRYKIRLRLTHRYRIRPKLKLEETWKQDEMRQRTEYRNHPHGQGRSPDESYTTSYMGSELIETSSD